MKAARARAGRPESRSSRPGGKDGARHGSSERAFSLVEILLAMALVALLAAVLIGSGTQALNRKLVSADDVFWEASREARKLALESLHEVRLAYIDDHEKGRRFTIDNNGSSREFPVVATGDVGVNFLSAQKTSGSAVILAGQLVETQSLPFVTFYSDGTCTAFRVQIRSGVNAHFLSIDPWTCARVLRAEEEK